MRSEARWYVDSTPFEKTVRQDEEHLRLLSIFHYVVAGLAGLFALFPPIHLLVGLALLTGALGADTDEPSARIGCYSGGQRRGVRGLYNDVGG